MLTDDRHTQFIQRSCDVKGDLERPKLLTHGLTEPGIMFAVCLSQSKVGFILHDKQQVRAKSQPAHLSLSQQQEKGKLFCVLLKCSKGQIPKIWQLEKIESKELEPNINILICQKSTTK